VGRDFAQALTEAVEAHPEDLDARESLAVCLAWRGQLGPALEACEAVLARAPRRELALSDAGLIAQQLKRTDQSIAYWERALAVNPRVTRYRFALAQLLAIRGDWERAGAESRRVLAQDGTHAFSRVMLVRYYLYKGQRAEARTELETALALHPPIEAQLRKQYAELLR
jgi:tetratricopeptide (TPR) repeat protein